MTPTKVKVTQEVTDKELIEELYSLAEGMIYIADSLKQSLESQDDEETIDSLHKLAMETEIPVWIEEDSR